MNNNEINSVGSDYNQQKKTNTIAIVGFIFSFLFALVGLILSIIGLKKSKKLNSGKGLSIAGIIISSLSLIFGFIMIYVLYLIINEALYLSDKSNITNKIYCSQSYDCVKSSEGWNCKYKDSNGKEYQIMCNHNNEKKENNDSDNNDKFSKENITGIWTPNQVLDIYGNEYNPAHYFGSISLENGSIFNFYSNNTYENFLTTYEDINDVTGTYKIENDKIYLTNKKGITSYIDFTIMESEELALKLYEGDMIIFLTKTDFSSNTKNYQIYSTGYDNGQDVLAKDFILDEKGSLYASLNINYPEFSSLNLLEVNITGTDLKGYYIMNNIKKMVSFEIGDSGYTYEFVLSNDGKVYFIKNGAINGVSFIQKEIPEFYGIEDFYRDKQTNEICLKKGTEIQVLSVEQLLSYTHIDY